MADCFSAEDRSAVVDHSSAEDRNVAADRFAAVVNKLVADRPWAVLLDEQAEVELSQCDLAWTVV
jgi:hypothetical protein